LRQKYRGYLVEILKREVAIGKEETSDREFSSLERRVGALIEVAFTLSHIPDDPVGSNDAFTSLLKVIAEIWPDFASNYRHVLSREVWNLPIQESESWWDLTLRLRAEK
jgi:hypothetical protein